MTVENNKIFDYIFIVDNEYVLKENVPKDILEQVLDFIYNFEKIYHQKLKIRKENSIEYL